MSFSMTRTVAESFTLTNAKYLASKVTTAMRRCQQLYGSPSDPNINDYGTEIAIYLRDGYIKSYEFGFVRVADDERILTWKYSVDSSGNLASNDRPGRILAGANIGAASFRTYLKYTDKYTNLASDAKAAAKASVPIQRTEAEEYGSSLGTWQYDLCYSSSGVAMSRQTFKLYGT